MANRRKRSVVDPLDAMIADLEERHKKHNKEQLAAGNVTKCAPGGYDKRKCSLNKAVSAPTKGRGAFESRSTDRSVIREAGAPIKDRVILAVWPGVTVVRHTGTEAVNLRVNHDGCETILTGSVAETVSDLLMDAEAMWIEGSTFRGVNPAKYTRNGFMEAVAGSIVVRAAASASVSSSRRTN